MKKNILAFGVWAAFMFIITPTFAATPRVYNAPRVITASEAQMVYRSGTSPVYLNTREREFAQKSSITEPKSKRIISRYPSGYTAMMLNIAHLSPEQQREIFVQNREKSTNSSGYEGRNGYRGIGEINDRKADLVTEAQVDAFNATK
jgi:hypothetical protein